MTMSLRPWTTRLLGVAACLALGMAAIGCAQREPARGLIRAMQESTLEQGRITRQTVHALVASYFREVEAQLQAQVALQRGELREEIHRVAQRRVDDVAAISVAQLEAALEGPVARLDGALRQEQAKPVALRDRAHELELAIQLSTTLAALGRESDRLVQRTAERGAVARERALAFVDQRVAALRILPGLDLEPEALAREVLVDFESSSAAYDQDLVDGLAELERHLEGSRLALRAFASGAFGERLGERVAGRAVELLERGEALLGKGMRECRTEALAGLERLP